MVDQHDQLRRSHDILRRDYEDLKAENKSLRSKLIEYENYYQNTNRDLEGYKIMVKGMAQEKDMFIRDNSVLRDENDRLARGQG